jgi:transcriptional regulator with XRE-family HTH domain
MVALLIALNIAYNLVFKAGRRRLSMVVAVAYKINLATGELCMVNETQAHLNFVDSSDETPQELTKQEFARKLYTLIMEKGWNQSELGRRAGVGRDAISTYMRGRSFPEPKTLHKLSKALGVNPEELLPNVMTNAVERDEPALSIQESSEHPGKCWVRLNRLMTSEQALRIMQVLHEADKSVGLLNN